MKLFIIILITIFLLEIRFVYVFFWNNLAEQFKSKTTSRFSRDFMDQQNFGSA